VPHRLSPLRAAAAAAASTAVPRPGVLATRKMSASSRLRPMSGDPPLALTVAYSLTRSCSRRGIGGSKKIWGRD
jgi:hypothetical protein